MKSTKHNLSKNRVKLSINVDPKQVTACFDCEYDKLKDSVEIAGFRKGKAPKVMTVEKIGHAHLAQLALQRAVDQAFRTSLTEHSLYPVTPPNISIAKHPSFLDDESKNELVFEVEFDILPKAKIGNYKKIKVDKVDPKSIEVSAEEVSKVINYLRRQAAQLKAVDKPLAKGDWVELDFTGSIKGVIKEKLTSKSLPIVVGETKLIPGFEEKIINMKKGDKKTFEVVLPADFFDKEFAGEKVKFDVTIIEIKGINLPEIDNDFLQRFGLKTEKQMRENIKKGLVEEKKERARRKQITQIADQITRMTKVDIPKALIENEQKRIKEALLKDLASKGMILEKYLQSLKTTEEKLEADLKVQAERNIILGVGVGEIAKAEKINLSENKGTNAVFEYLIANNVR